MREFIINFPLFSILLALLCAALSLPLRARSARALTVSLLSAVAVLSAAVLAQGLVSGESVTYTMGEFPAPWGNEIRFGILEPLMAVAFSTVMLLCIIGGRNPLEKKAEHNKLHVYYAMVDLVCAAVLTLCYTNDIFTSYVFIEICAMASCGLLVIRESGRALVAAIRYMIFNLLGSGLFLLGVILLYGITGHLLMPQLKEGVAAIWETGNYGQSLTVVISLIVAGISIKSGLFPFHIWVADAHGSTVSSSSGILSGVVFKGYIVLLVKLIFCVFGTEVFYACGAANVLFVYGVLGMMFGSISAIQERHFKRMVAYSPWPRSVLLHGTGISPAGRRRRLLPTSWRTSCAKPALFLSATVADASAAWIWKRIRGAGEERTGLGISHGRRPVPSGHPRPQWASSPCLLAGAGVGRRLAGACCHTLLALASAPS
jgi:multicomponent Na+:H+ antiporter subunit D